MYILIEKSAQKALLYQYLTPHLNQLLNLSKRKIQRLMEEENKWENETYVVYNCGEPIKGKRGGKRQQTQ